MILLIALSVFGVALSAVIDPSLTEWKLIEANLERHTFPLRDYILEVKAFLPDVYDTNPSYGELLRTDKSTTMMILLHEGNYNNKVGRLVWNTIKYDKGFDVAIEECDARYKAYRSFPANGEREQIWAWNFFDDYTELTCNGEIQYERNFDEGEFHPFVAVTNPQNCRALGDAAVDKLEFKHMKGKYIRGIPKNKDVVDETDPPTDEGPTPTDQDPDDIIQKKTNPTCDCWTAECGYCSNLECTIKQDLSNSDNDIEVKSKLTYKKTNTVMFFDEDGNTIGSLNFNLKSIQLTGCVSCYTPSILARAARSSTSNGKTDWSVSLKDGVLSIKIAGEVLYSHKLAGECKEIYGNATRFAFTGLTCENTFTVHDDMDLGANINHDCGGQCA